MTNLRITNKHVAVNKAKTVTVSLIAVAAVITVSSLMVARSFIIQARYINKVNGKKEVALKQLKANEAEVDILVDSYKSFSEQPTNILSGKSVGSGASDGDNAKLVLDALPSKYDFPALISSIETMLKGTKVNSITGVDTATARLGSAATPEPVEIPFSFNINASYPTVAKIIGDFEHSIRPFSITRLDLSGTYNDLKVTIDAVTYYQPAKDLQITSKEVK